MVSREGWIEYQRKTIVLRRTFAIFGEPGKPGQTDRFLAHEASQELKADPSGSRVAAAEQVPEESGDLAIG
jgi:hypothetical protein